MPIPADHGECVAHFIKKGKSRAQANAICYDVARRRKKEIHKEAEREVLNGGKR